MKLRYVGMLVAGTLAGVLSGSLLLVPHGLMGGALGLGLSIGAIPLGIQKEKRGGTLDRGQILLTGLFSGLLAGLLMVAVVLACDFAKMQRFAFFHQPSAPWTLLTMGALYGVVVHWGYAKRLGSADPFGASLGWTCMGCFLVRGFAMVFYLMLFQHEGNLAGTLIGCFVLSFFGAVPFAALWIWAMKRSDPAW